MAKFHIIMACGHEETHNICGKVKDRERHAECIGQRFCKPCLDKKQAELKATREKENETKNALSAETNKLAGLPALIGTPKQIAWAENIRDTTLDALNTVADRAEIQKNDERPEWAKLAVWMIGRIAEIRNTTAASWWIENREVNWSTQFHKEAKKLGLI